MSSITMLAPVPAAWSQNYPTRPVRILAGEPGGGADVTARSFTETVSLTLGQPLVVDNRPSALIPDVVAKANPDGYTMAISGSVTWITPLIQKATYDPIKDFA